MAKEYQNDDTTTKSERLLRLVIDTDLIDAVKSVYRWEGPGYDLIATETVKEHEKDMSDFAKYLFEVAPIGSLDEATKAQILLLINLHDLDEWRDGDVSINVQNEMTQTQLAARRDNKRKALQDLLTEKISESDDIEALIEIYDAFENRHESKPLSELSWIKPLALAYTGLLDRLQGTAFKLRNSTEITPVDVQDALTRVGKELKLLYGLSRKEIDLSSFYGKMSHLEEELWRILAHEIFWKESPKDGSRWNPRPARIVREEGGLVDMAKGAKNLHELQRNLDSVLFGEDVNIEFEKTNGNEVLILPNGGRQRVKARIPTGYFGTHATSLNFEPDLAIAEALLRENLASRKSAIDIATATAINQPIERSRAAQLSMNILMNFDMKKVTVSSEGYVIIDMDIVNTSPFLTYRFSTQELVPAFRLVAEPTERMITGDALIQNAKKIVGCSDEEVVNYLHIAPGGVPIALKLPVQQYVDQDIPTNTHSAVDMNHALTQGKMTRIELDNLLCSRGMVDSPNKLFASYTHRNELMRPFTIIGETMPVSFPRDIVGRISQNILVEVGDKQRWIGRHGGSRYVDPGFGSALDGYESEKGLPIRTEILVSTGSLDALGQQYIIVYLYPGKPKK